MIHTGTMTFNQVTKEMMKSFISKSGTVPNGKNTWVNHSMRDYGVSVIARNICKGKAYFNTMKCRINFSKLISQENTVKVFQAVDYPEMVQAFNRVMEILELPEWYEWTANRIDYCVDVHTPYVKEYVRLLQKGDIPYHQKIAYNSITRNRTHIDGSVYLPAKSHDKRSRKTGSATINFYSKENERTKAGSSDEIIEQSKGILRLEVQCHKPKLDYLKKKYNLDDKCIANFIRLDICKDVIEKALLGVCKKGDYYRRSVALECINESNYQAKTKQTLINIICDISKQKRSIAITRCKYADAGMDRKRFNSYLNKLDDLGVNPVMLSDNLKLDNLSHKDGLSNLYDLFFDALQQEYIAVERVAGEEWNDEPAISYTIE